MNIYDELTKLSPEEAIPETQYRVQELRSGWWAVERDWGGDHWSVSHFGGENAYFITKEIAEYAKTAIIARERLTHAQTRTAQARALKMRGKK